MSKGKHKVATFKAGQVSCDTVMRSLTDVSKEQDTPSRN